MMGRLTFFLVSLTLVSGCGSSGTTPEVKNDPVAPVKSAEPPTDQNAKADAPAAPKVADVPASLKHDGFLYYGLNSVTPQKMKLNQAGSTVEGAQTFELETVAADSAVFKQVWSGGLPAADSKVQVTEKGIFGIEAKGTKIDPPQMELPANPVAGMTWKSDAKVEVDGSTITNSTGKIIGVQSVKVGGKSIQALVVKRTSKVSSGSVTQTMATTEYYEKGVGAVKLEVTMSGGGQPTRSFSMEAMP